MVNGPNLESSLQEWVRRQRGLLKKRARLT
jgi:hypothetical protein